mgnify:CR=1 FL=1
MKDRQFLIDFANEFNETCGFPVDSSGIPEFVDTYLLPHHTELSYEEGKTYKTKFATGELFHVTKIVRNHKNEIIRFIGIYDKCKHLGECPLNPDRLILE